MGVRRTANMCSYQTKKPKYIERVRELQNIVRAQGARIEELKQEHKEEIIDIHFKWCCALTILTIIFICGLVLIYGGKL